MQINLVNTTGLVKTCKVGFSWTTLFFGFFVPLIRGDWKHFFIMLIVCFLTCWVACIPFAFIYNKWYIKSLLENGWSPQDEYSMNTLKSKGINYVGTVPVQKVSTPKKVHKTIEYKVVGTTYKNEDGDSIQDILQHIPADLIDHEELYNGETNADIKEYGERVSIYEGNELAGKIEETEFEKEPAIKVYLKDVNNKFRGIGWISKPQVEEVKAIFQNHDCTAGIMIVGGKYKYLNDDEKVETDESTYGARLIVHYDELS